MSKSELIDNLTFASALQMLKQLVEQGLLPAPMFSGWVTGTSSE